MRGKADITARALKVTEDPANAIVSVSRGTSLTSATNSQLGDKRGIR